MEKTASNKDMLTKNSATSADPLYTANIFNDYSSSATEKNSSQY